MNGDVVSLLDGLLGMSNRALYVTLAAVGLPWLIAVIARARWSPPLKAGFAFAACGGATVLYLAVTGQLSGGDWLRTTLLVFVGATLIYRLFHRPIETVERATG